MNSLKPFLQFKYHALYIHMYWFACSVEKCVLFSNMICSKSGCSQWLWLAESRRGNLFFLHFEITRMQKDHKSVTRQFYARIEYWWILSWESGWVPHLCLINWCHLNRYLAEICPHHFFDSNENTRNFIKLQETQYILEHPQNNLPGLCFCVILFSIPLRSVAFPQVPYHWMQRWGTTCSPGVMESGEMLYLQTDNGTVGSMRATECYLEALSPKLQGRSVEAKHTCPYWTQENK